jgi:hypothetical protein
MHKTTVLAMTQLAHNCSPGSSKLVLTGAYTRQHTCPGLHTARLGAPPCRDLLVRVAEPTVRLDSGRFGAPPGASCCALWNPPPPVIVHA